MGCLRTYLTKLKSGVQGSCSIEAFCGLLRFSGLGRICAVVFQQTVGRQQSLAVFRLRSWCLSETGSGSVLLLAG